jgi:hypothetical protein
MMMVSVHVVYSVFFHQKSGEYILQSLLFFSKCSLCLRLNLFSYMSAEFIMEKLSLVCKPLRSFILSSQSYWKYRYETHVRAPYRSAPSKNGTWFNVCYDLERIGHEWEECGKQHQNILSISGAHIGPLTDTIILEVYLTACLFFQFNLIFRMVIHVLQVVVIHQYVVGIYDD